MSAASVHIILVIYSGLHFKVENYSGRYYKEENYSGNFTILQFYNFTLLRFTV